MFMFRWKSILICIGFMCSSAVLADAPSPQGLAQLRAKLERQLAENHVAGAGVALIEDGQPVWVAGLGQASLSPSRPADADTRFRIGSISKGLVGIAAMQLVEQGRVRLDARLHDLLPDVAIDNPWEATDPVRLVHVLEHTAGFDGDHPRQLAYAATDAMTTLDAVHAAADLLHSRWRPGSRWSYSNIDYALAALVVEKISGERFEDYVSAHIFRPLNMGEASYFQTPAYAARGATLYAEGQPTPYWHVLERPAGAANASAREMVNYLQFYINRGSLNDRRVLGADSLRRLEHGETLAAARLGMGSGYGFGNYDSEYKGFVFRGHNGGLPGAAAQLAYLPEARRGYVVMLNTDADAALDAISASLKDFLIRDLKPAPRPTAQPMPEALSRQLPGYYVLMNSMVQQMRFADIFAMLTRVEAREDGLVLAPLLAGPAEVYHYAGAGLFRKSDERLTSLALLPGEPLTLQTPCATLQRWPLWRVLAAAAAVTVFGLAVLGAVLLTSWCLYRLLRRRPGWRTAWRVWGLPFAGLLSLAMIFALISSVHGDQEMLDKLGHLSATSLGISVLLWGLGVAALSGLVNTLRHSPRRVGLVVYGQSLLTSSALVLLAAYLAYWGALGLRTWAY